MRRIVEEEALIKVLEDNYCVIIYTGSEHNLNEQDDNVDVEIVLDNGERYSATFFTLKNIRSIMQKDKLTGECCNGLYFGGCKDVVLVETLTIETIAAVIRSAHENGEMETICNTL